MKINFLLVKTFCQEQYVMLNPCKQEIFMFHGVQIQKRVDSSYVLRVYLWNKFSHKDGNTVFHCSELLK